MATDDDEPAGDEPAGDVDEQDQGAGDASADERRPARTTRGNARRPARSISGSDGAGWVLGLFLWAGVVLPFLKGGPSEVGAWWRAKFLNQAPDGSELP